MLCREPSGGSWSREETGTAELLSRHYTQHLRVETPALWTAPLSICARAQLIVKMCPKVIASSLYTTVAYERFHRAAWEICAFITTWNARLKFGFPGRRVGGPATLTGPEHPEAWAKEHRTQRAPRMFSFKGLGITCLPEATGRKHYLPLNLNLCL